MRSIHGLQIHLRVPVRVVDNDDVGGVQVDAETTGSGGEHEEELLAVLGVVLGDLTVSVPVGSLAVDAAVVPASEPAVVLQDVQHSESEDLRKLRTDSVSL